jgi:cytochrome oxidase assembly protein ShyY1
LERLPLKVFIIELDFDGNRQFIAAVHLGPSGQSRYEMMNAPLGSEGYKIILIEQGWARSNKTQVTHEDAP